MTNPLPVFTITRLFDAPCETLWNAWTRPEEMSEWFAPTGFTSDVRTLELRPGGMLHTRMRAADGTEIWGRFLYQEITPPARLVWRHSFSDEAAGLTRHPFSADWPLELLTTLTLAEKNGRTELTLTWVPHQASETEQRAFAEGMESMKQGWTGTFDKLEHYLAERDPSRKKAAS